MFHNINFIKIIYVYTCIADVNAVSTGLWIANNDDLKVVNSGLAVDIHYNNYNLNLGVIKKYNYI